MSSFNIVQFISILCEEEENEMNTPTEESKGSLCNEDDDDYSFTDIDFDEDVSGKFKI